MATRELDDIYKRKKYKESIYADKKSTLDDYTGKRIFKGNERESNYKHPVYKTSDTDHITPIKVVEKRYSNLSKEQQRELVNNEKHNYATTNSKLNRSKGDLENHEYLIRQIKNGNPEDLRTSATMLYYEADSRVAMRMQATKMQIENSKEKLLQSDIILDGYKTTKEVKNIGENFISGSKDTLIKSAIPLTAEAVRKMCNIANRKESIDDAVKDMGKVVFDVAVSGGTNKLLIDLLNRNTKISNILGSDNVAQIIAVTAIVKESAIKYINGEIDGKEFIEEVGQKGSVMVAGMIGGAVGQEMGMLIGGVIGTVLLPGAGTTVGVVAGKVIGEILGTIITTVACGAIVSVYDTLKHMDDYKLKEKEIKLLEHEALYEINKQREKFKSIVEKEYRCWDEKIESGFNMILSSACEEIFNLQGVTDGLDKILSIFGKSVAFKSINEYEAQLDIPLKLNF